IVVSSISWQGMPATRAFAQGLNQNGRSCRTELWQMVAPPTGTAPLVVTLSAPTAFGVGAAAYSGVNQQDPLSLAVSAEGSASPVEITDGAPDDRPAIGVACLGGVWPGNAGPDAVAAPGDLAMWDFTEPNVVGLGSHRLVAG